MKNLLKLSFMVILFMANTAQSDILLGAPGLVVPQVASKLPFKVNYTITNLYKYVFRGIEAKGNTLGAPGHSGSSGNGGQFHLSASVSGSKEGKIDFRDEPDYNTAPYEVILITPPVIWKATTTPISVNIEWKGEGNAKKPDGFFNILGESQTNPPPPVGNLNMYAGDFILAETGGKPLGMATITRE